MIKHSILYLALIFSIILGTHEGFVALWRTPGTEPEMVFPTRITSLPRADQEALEKGIVVRSNQELQALLEDFLS